MVDTLSFRRRNLPHWMVAERPYFITLRLAGSLPRKVVDALRAERDECAEQGAVDEASWTELMRRQFRRVDALLDAASVDSKWLAVPAVAGMVLENLGWLEGRGWRIYAAVVMGNHVHVALRNLAGRNGELQADLSHFKRFTAVAANKCLGRAGRFWASEVFDHWCRNEDKLRAACAYTCMNPVRAGLVGQWRDWPWVRCEEEYAPR